MVAGSALERARDALGQRRWREAYELLAESDAEHPLEPSDLELLAEAGFLLGRDAGCIDAWTRAHHEHLSRGDPARAARCAFWLGFVHINTAEMAPAMGWFARGRRILDDADLDCAERGFLLLPLGIQTVEDDPGAACSIFESAEEIGERFGEVDLVSKARVSRGRCIIRMGRVAEGLSLLDEGMVAATAGEVSALSVGDLYCTVIEGCFEVHDLRRAQEWTAALYRWCEEQPDLVPYRGQCLVHRAEIMQMHGSWPDALEEARQACERLARHPMLGAAFYQLAELHRVRGEFGEAEEAYREAHRRGKEPQPGLSLLRVGQGRLEAAAAAIRRVADESAGSQGAAKDDPARPGLLGPFVEIMLAVGDVEAAREAADELARTAQTLDVPYVHGVAAQAKGAVALAQGDPRGSLDALRASRAVWEELDAPHEVARVRLLIGLACRALGDADSADLEIDAARAALERLGATPDLDRLGGLTGQSGSKPHAELTGRELEVLVLVTDGKTNREIGKALVISEHTVARHMSNIFTKLGVSSRAAATAYAFEHDLV